MAVVLGFRWRTSGDKDAPQMRDSTLFLPNETVDDLRCRLALECGSSAANAANIGPELWRCMDDENATPTERVNAPAILDWMPTTCPALLFENYPSGRSKAVILFTFPPLIAGTCTWTARLALVASRVCGVTCVCFPRCRRT